MPDKVARRYRVSGRVQGVGFRYFVLQAAVELGVEGYVRNLGDGDVEAVAAGAEAQLTEFSARLHRGPRVAEVRRVTEEETALERFAGFRIR